MMCFAYTEQGMLGMLDTFCGLFWRMALYHMWASGPHQQLFFPSPAKAQRVSDLHL